MNGSAIIDRSLKALARRAAPAFVRLADLSVEPSAIRWEDVTVSLPELRGKGIDGQACALGDGRLGHGL